MSYAEGGVLVPDQGHTFRRACSRVLGTVGAGSRMPVAVAEGVSAVAASAAGSRAYTSHLALVTGLHGEGQRV